MPFPASPLPDWQVLGADRRIPVPPTPAPSPAQLAGRPQSPQVAGGITQRGPQRRLPAHPPGSPQTRPSPTPLRSQPRAPPARPGPGPAATSEKVTRSGSRTENGEDSGEHAPSPPGSGRALPAARRCLCPSPRNWNSTTAARSWNHVLPLPPPPPARHAAPEQMTTGLASRDSALRTRPPPPPRRPRALLCLRQRTQREPPRSLPTVRASQASPPRLRPITTPRVFPPPPRDPHLRIGERRGPT